MKSRLSSYCMDVALWSMKFIKVIFRNSVIASQKTHSICITNTNQLSAPPTSLHFGLGPFGLSQFVPLKHHMRASTTKTTSQSRKLHTWLRNTETDLYCNGILKIMQRREKFLVHSEDFMEMWWNISCNSRWYMFFYISVPPLSHLTSCTPTKSD
jgi:hypothetical protein